MFLKSEKQGNSNEGGIQAIKKNFKKTEKKKKNKRNKLQMKDEVFEIMQLR